jgi:hypothetical protein
MNGLGVSLERMAATPFVRVFRSRKREPEPATRSDVAGLADPVAFLKVGLSERMALMTRLKHWIAGVMGIAVICALVPVAGAADVHDAEHRGCCSYHQGVCGCEGGRAKCCDGGLSPTCGCD